jgi:hypothetical protein
MKAWTPINTWTILSLASVLSSMPLKQLQDFQQQQNQPLHQQPPSQGEFHTWPQQQQDQIPPAAPPGPIPAAAAATAFPANISDFAPPTEWQVLSPLPPDDPDNSFGNEFFDANNSDDDNLAAGAPEDRVWLESESTPDYNSACLEASPDTGYPPTPHSAPSPSRPDTSLLFAGFTSLPSCSCFCPPPPLPAPRRERRRRRSQRFWWRPSRRSSRQLHKKVFQLTCYILGLQNRLPIMKPSSIQLTNIRKKQTKLYKLCRAFHCTLSSEAGSVSDSGHGSSEMMR